jgi:hypothetical protein
MGEHSLWPHTGAVNEPIAWTIEHFSLANPKGRGQGNVPLLLRRVADVIEGFGTAEVQDLLLHAEVNEFGDWPSITVYFHRGHAACGHLRRRVLSRDRSPAARDRPV